MYKTRSNQQCRYASNSILFMSERFRFTTKKQSMLSAVQKKSNNIPESLYLQTHSMYLWYTLPLIYRKPCHSKWTSEILISTQLIAFVINIDCCKFAIYNNLLQVCYIQQFVISLLHSIAIFYCSVTILPTNTNIESHQTYSMQKQILCC